MSRPWKPEDWYEVHNEPYQKPHLAVNVKMPGSFWNTISKLDIPENDANTIFERICESFWNWELEFICESAGYAGAHGEGRSGGWCIPYVSKSGNSFTYPPFEDRDGFGDIHIPDREERNRFLKFYKLIQAYKESIPAQIKEIAQEILDYQQDQVSMRQDIAKEGL
jgi:hypothetical protein